MNHVSILRKSVKKNAVHYNTVGVRLLAEVRFTTFLRIELNTGLLPDVTGIMNRS
jgi:hypothetical protein